MTRHLDDDFLPCRLAALEKLSEELAAKMRYWERLAKALKYSYAAHQTTVISRDTLASMDGFELVDTEDSELGERAIRVELVRRGAEQQGA